MRIAALWARSRNITLVAVCLIISSVLVWRTALLLDHGLTPQPQNRIPATLLAALFGATLLSATLPPIDWDIETRLAWTPAFAYTSVALLAGRSASHIVTWMRNDGDDRLSWLIAAVLAAVGLMVFVLRGPKRVR